MSKYAYVTFIIRNDSYLPGALVFAYALRMQETKHDLLCIVSDNISASAIRQLRVLYDDVIVMPEVYVAHDRRQERQDRPFLFSRFNAFRLGADGDLGKNYEKIIIADCDLLPIKDYDTLFELDAPAGIINEKKEYCMTYEDGVYIVPVSVYEKGEWVWHDVYRDFPHGHKIPKKVTDRVLKDPNNMGVNTSLMLFKPSMALYDSIMADLEDPEIQKTIAGYNWPEMQYITQKMSGHWTNIDLRYSSFNGYPIIDVLYGIHFAGMKPWAIKNKSLKSYRKFEDYQLFFMTFQSMLDTYPELKQGKLARIYDYFNDLTSDPKYHFVKTYLPPFRYLNKK